MHVVGLAAVIRARDTWRREGGRRECEGEGAAHVDGREKSFSSIHRYTAVPIITLASL